MLDCCSRAFAGCDSQPLRAPDKDFDWTRLVSLSRRHRVQGIVWDGLSNAPFTCPDKVRELLSADAAAIARRNLQAAVESKRLAELFGEADIPLRFVKGLTLGALAYRDPFLKMAKDIDLLVPADRVRQAAQLLFEAGYEPIDPAQADTADSVARWHLRSKESAWLHRDARIHLDLHSRLADNPALIPGIGTDSSPCFVEVADGIRLPTLPAEDLFAYLCVHGASSAWFRLKWVSDLASLICGADEEQVARHYARSQRLGAGRSAAQALLLVRDLFGFGPGPDLDRRLRSTPANRLLLKIALFHLEGWLGRREPTETPLGTAGIHLSQLLLRPGLKFKLTELQRQIALAR